MSTRIASAAFCLLAPVAMTAGVSRAAFVEFPTSGGGTGNSYEVVQDNATSHTDAVAAAVAAGGHLVTITSASEQSFVESLLLNSGVSTGGYWMGLNRISADGFAWTTGEPFEFVNFPSGEPNNFLGIENFGQVYWSKDIADDIASRRGSWNDAPEAGYTGADIPDLNLAGFIIERTAPTTTEPPPVAIPLPPALLAAPLGMLIAGLASRRKRIAR